jgi:hypothetical protein
MVGHETARSVAGLSGTALAIAVLAVLVLVVLLAEIVRRRSNSARLAPTQLRIDVDFICGVGHKGGADGRVAPEELVGLVRGELNELTALADQLYGMMDLARHEPEVTDEAFVRIDDLRWLLGNYVLKGGRVRRLVGLPRLLKAIDALDRPDVKQPQRPIGVLRSAAAELLAQITDTNTRTVDWLLAHRVALPDPDHINSNALLNRYDRLAIEPVSISGDPLYLLTCHIHDILETVESLGQLEHPMLEVLETQLTGPLAALEHEITSAQAFNSALISLARAARSADAA